MSQEKKEEVRKIQQKLMQMGHTISHDWTQHKSIKPYHENRGLAKKYAEREMKAIQHSDIFIGIINKKGITLLQEIGAALMLREIQGKPRVYLTGSLKENSIWFFTEHAIKKETAEEILQDINESN